MFKSAKFWLLAPLVIYFTGMAMICLSHTGLDYQWAFSFPVILAISAFAFGRWARPLFIVWFYLLLLAGNCVACLLNFKAMIWLNESGLGYTEDGPYFGEAMAYYAVFFLASAFFLALISGSFGRFVHQKK